MTIKGHLVLHKDGNVCEQESLIGSNKDIQDPFKGKIVWASQLSFEKGGKKTTKQNPKHRFSYSLSSHSVKIQNSFRRGLSTS